MRRPRPQPADRRRRHGRAGFGLALAPPPGGARASKRVQLTIEYSPQPPFNAGTSDRIGPKKLAEARKGRVWMDGEALKAAEAAAVRLGLASTVERQPAPVQDEA